MTQPGPPIDLNALASADSLADAALENLINQFARPLDFLRELVQNSIDAGSPRVEVRIERHSDPANGQLAVLAIHVEDWGEGMDERIIDSQLTRLFASTKEDDLTKIGKFGIGFTSIFAIQPEAVILRTGRHGESWELFFHPDRSFEKVRLDDPVAGTRVSLFKRLPAADVPSFVRECEWILGFWCEHSDTLIQFLDLTDGGPTAQADGADPFAAFDLPAMPNAPNAPNAPAAPSQVNRPLDLDADLVVRHQDQGVQVVVGLSPRPRFGFYNGGLTLVQSQQEEVLGTFAPRSRHLSFKIKYDRLEHTLTRDNVLQDRNWTLAMETLLSANEKLELELLAALEKAVQTEGPLGHLHRYFAAACRSSALHVRLPQGRSAAILRDHQGRPVSLAQLERSYQDHGAVLLVPASPELRAALEEAEILLFEDDPDLREVLDATWRTPFFALRLSRRRVVSADQIYLLPQSVPSASLRARERDLLAAVSALLAEATGDGVELRLSELAGGDEATLVLEGAADQRIFRRTGGHFRWLPPLFRARRVLIDRAHPSFQARLILAGEQPRAAALALTHLVLEALDIDREEGWTGALAAAHSGEAWR